MKTLFVLCIFLISCTSLNKNSKKDLNLIKRIDPNDVVQFKKALQDMNRNHYAKAQPVFKKLATQYKGQDLQWASLYNLADIYKQMGQCYKAELIYQKILKKNHKVFKPPSYLLLGYVYECQGKIKETLSILKQGLSTIHLLPEKTRQVEYPARLFLAYIRAGQDSAGHLIQKQVLDNMDKIKKTSPIVGTTEKIFSEYFYLMGKSYIQSHAINLKNFLKMAWYYQLYLTQSFLLKKGKWSVYSEKELKNIYRKIKIQLKKNKNKALYKKEVDHLLNSLYKLSQSSSNQNFQILYHQLSQPIKNLMTNTTQSRGSL